MEIIFVLILGSFLGFHVPVTQVHQDCLNGDDAACKVDKKINHYID